MKAKILFFIVLFLKFAILKSQTNVDFIKKIQNYKEAVKITASGLMFNDSIDTSTFNIKAYMEMYPAIKIKEKGYIFDYYYYDNWSDAKPHIYVKSKNFNLINHINKNADEIKLKGGERDDFIRRSIYWFLKDSCNKANQNVFPEDTEAGYFQYLYFYEFGEQFALKWHASYKKKKVITAKQELEEILNQYAEQLQQVDTIGIEREMSGSSISFCDTTALQHFLLSDSVISVQFNVDHVIVKWLELEEWRGLFERTYKIMRTKPYRIELIKEKHLVGKVPSGIK